MLSPVPSWVRMTKSPFAKDVALEAVIPKLLIWGPLSNGY
nr:MAG TPA: hypothetical protein [Caudoviricetes sp.]